MTRGWCAPCKSAIATLAFSFTALSSSAVGSLMYCPLGRHHEDSLIVAPRLLMVARPCWVLSLIALASLLASTTASVPHACNGCARQTRVTEHVVWHE
jgi:hypothetical protein